MWGRRSETSNMTVNGNVPLTTTKSCMFISTGSKGQEHASPSATIPSTSANSAGQDYQGGRETQFLQINMVKGHHPHKLTTQPTWSTLLFSLERVMLRMKEVFVLSTTTGKSTRGQRVTVMVAAELFKAPLPTISWRQKNNNRVRQ